MIDYHTQKHRAFIYANMFMLLGLFFVPFIAAFITSYIGLTLTLLIYGLLTVDCVRVVGNKKIKHAEFQTFSLWILKTQNIIDFYLYSLGAFIRHVFLYLPSAILSQLLIAYLAGYGKDIFTIDSLLSVSMSLIQFFWFYTLFNKIFFAYKKESDHQQ